MSFADEIVCATEPPNSWAVGQSYRNFSQISDSEVQELLAAVHQTVPNHDRPTTHPAHQKWWVPANPTCGFTHQNPPQPELAGTAADYQAYELNAA